VSVILLTGVSGQVGNELERTLAPLGRVVATGRDALDLASERSIRDAVRRVAPRIIVNAAGYTAVDKAEAEPALAMQVNGTAPGILAEEAALLGALLVHYSTDYVFDGTSARPYTEEDAVNPVNAYGRSKLAGEEAIRAANPAHLILRTSWIYCERGSNFLLTILKLARQRAWLEVVDDQIGSPTWARALAETTARLLADEKRCRENAGTYHLAAGGATSRFEFVRTIIEVAREKLDLPGGWAQVRPIKTAQYPLPGARPLNSATSKDKIRRVFGIEMAPWRQQLEDCLGDAAARAAFLRVARSE
jgi:dTDP-4-dehydrorhamnose reductase